jgi:hypothetical protein
LDLSIPKPPSTCSSGSQCPKRRWSRRWLPCGTTPTWPKSSCCRPACGPSSMPWWSGSTTASPISRSSWRDWVTSPSTRWWSTSPFCSTSPWPCTCSKWPPDFVPPCWARPRCWVRYAGRPSGRRRSGPPDLCSVGSFARPSKPAGGCAPPPPSPGARPPCRTSPWSWLPVAWVVRSVGVRWWWSGQARWARALWPR